MRYFKTSALIAMVSILSATSAYASCSGSNGRGWGRGAGNGQFAMSAQDKNCKISFPSFINDASGVKTPATQVSITKSPKNGKLSVVAGKGLIYTPAQGFVGKDKFCTKNKSPKFKEQALSGCVTVTVR